MLEIAILSLFPEYFRGPFDASILKRARERGALSIDLVDVRDYAEGKQRQVDDRPYGGGPGMVMTPGPVTRAIEGVRRTRSKVVYMSPQGRPFTAEKARELAQEEHLVILCGHYEGIDQRVIDREVDEELSIGDYVLTNGCLPAIVVVDALARFLPGVLGHECAAEEDSFENGLFDCPHYTRPDSFLGQSVPGVLLEGDHKKIAAWRHAEAVVKTERMRPDLYQRYMLAQGSQVVSDDSGQVMASFRLAVYSLKRSLAFYKGVLRMKPLEKGERHAIFSFGGVRLVLIEGGAEEIFGPRPLLELSLSSAAVFDGMARKALEAGVVIYGPRKEEIGLLETLTMELSDPDGYHLCLTCRQESETVRMSKE